MIEFRTMFEVLRKHHCSARKRRLVFLLGWDDEPRCERNMLDLFLSVHGLDKCRRVISINEFCVLFSRDLP